MFLSTVDCRKQKILGNCFTLGKPNHGGITKPPGYRSSMGTGPVYSDGSPKPRLIGRVATGRIFDVKSRGSLIMFFFSVSCNTVCWHARNGLEDRISTGWERLQKNDSSGTGSTTVMSLGRKTSMLLPWKFAWLFYQRGCV